MNVMISISSILFVFSVLGFLLILGLGVIWIIVRTASGGTRIPGTNADEAQLIQEMHQGLEKLERRIESLETLLLDKDRPRER